jgi:zinc transport system ATP-binding protein
MSVKTLIEVKNLSYTYEKEPVLKDVSFSVSEGDYVGIIGPNGGGKTTLLKILTGLLPLQEGNIQINGQSIGTLQSQLEIGYVPQKISSGDAAFPATVAEIVASGRTARKSLWEFGQSNKDRAAIDSALETTKISDLRDRLVSTLSGGQRQRVYIARALANKPRILILDEPLSGVDVANQDEFYAFIRELNEKHGLTIIFVSHDISVVLKEARSLLCLNQGLLCYDKPETLKEDALLHDMYHKPVTHLHTV